MWLHLLRCAACFLTLAALASCGGGGGSSEVAPPVSQPPSPPIVVGSALPPDVHWQPASGVVPSSGNFVYLESSAEDPVGQGSRELRSEVDSAIVFSVLNGGIQFALAHPERQWTGEFQGPESLKPGFYGDVRKAGVALPGLKWATEARECDALEGWFVVDAHVRDSNGTAAFEVRFMQRCQGSAGVLRGKLRWHRADSRAGATAAIPPTLWQPPVGALPATGSYVYLESQGDDYVGQGQTRLFSTPEADIRIDFIDSLDAKYHSLSVRQGSERVVGNFQHDTHEAALRRGYYPGVDRQPYATPGVGAMEWIIDRRRCGRVNGWLAVDDVAYFGDQIVAIELRFEQRCDLSKATLRGKVRYSLLDALFPAGPSAAPADLWQPTMPMPAAGDYVYIESDAGDPVGQGASALMTQANAALSGTPYLDKFSLRAQGPVSVSGDLRVMAGQPELAAGFYEQMPARSSDERTRGSATWSVQGRVCPSSLSWTAIDKVERGETGPVQAVEFRFEQRCTGAAGALRGKVRWTLAGAGSSPFGSPPASLWQMAAAKVPPADNFVYVEGDKGNLIAEAQVLFTPKDHRIIAQGGAANPPGVFDFGFSVPTETASWNGRVHRPASATRLLPGFYGNLAPGFPMPSTGGLEVSGEGLGCGSTWGWYAVDHVAYAGDLITDIDLRFEQRCSGDLGLLRGRIRWSAADTTGPAGPSATPAQLWAPAAGATPSGGNYLYLESVYGDPIGMAKTRLLTSADHDFSGGGAVKGQRQAADLGLLLRAKVDTMPLHWGVNFQAMGVLERIEPGWYPDVIKAPALNTAKAGLMVGGWCNVISGWVAVDKVSYVGDQLSMIELRFEQRCERVSAPLRGKLRWESS